MRIADNGVDHVSAPADYTDLFNKYYKYVVTLVGRSGIEESRKEDVANDILLRFYERDFLNEFDPTMVFHYDGEDRPARFKSFLTKFVLTYVRGHKDKQARLNAREVLLCDRPVGANGDSAWIDVFGPAAPSADAEVLALLDAQELTDKLRDYIATVPRRSRMDTCDLVALFDEVIRQIRDEGKWTVKALEAHFGISSTAMHTWMWWLRTNCARALGCPVPAKRPRRVRQREQVQP